MSLSLIAVPVLLDTTEHAPQLFHQWARMYHYGHQALPTMAVGTCLLYLYTAGKKRSSKSHQVLIAMAGLATVLMLPFTWLVMIPTNNDLFKLETVSRSEPNVMSLAEARELVVRWAQMHFTRCLFPLVGAVFGAFGTV